MEEDLREVEEDRLRVGGRLIGVLGEVGDADDGRGDRTGRRDRHPAHTDPPGDRRIGRGAQRHEADDDVRLAEVAQTPRKRGDDGEVGPTGPERPGPEEAEQARVDLPDVGNHLGGSAGIDDGDDGHGDEGGEHEQPLGDIGECGAEEAAEERVDHRDRGDDEHAREVVEAEARFEELPGRDHPRGDVEGEEDEDDEAADDAQQMRAILEALFEEARDGDRITGGLREGAEPGRDELPVHPGADGETDRDPGFDEAREVDRARQAHEQPARHVGGAGAQRCDAGSQSASGEHVVVEAVLGLPVGEPADGKHPREVEDDGDGAERCLGHGVSSPLISTGDFTVKHEPGVNTV
ncbi:Uncharacterised protein [Mycobacteroides abscessus subsp. abscessus]|nr:Uncharacterised protein [Mycobacteroides abscessus subsp. abscessus]